jgi:hypothetical protein
LVALEAAHALDIDAVEDHLQLAGRQLQTAGLGRGEVEAALLQPLVPEAQAVAVPVQDLEAVGPAVEEDEQVARERIGLELRADQGRQPVERGIFLIPPAARTARSNRSSPSPSSIPVTPCVAAPSG